jgi:UPF0716 protein FxsA
MFLRLFLLFTLVPLVELYALIRLGSLIGAGPTILLVLGTGAAGAWLARREGFRSWSAVQSELAAGRLPAEELLHALVVVIAGVLLVTPGVFTDAFGLLMLIRPVRAAMIRKVRSRIDRSIQSGDVHFWVHETSSQPGGGARRTRLDELPEAAEWPGASGDEHEPRRGRVIDV